MLFCVHCFSVIHFCDILFSDSTRSLYEKKLKEAMAKGKRPKTSPDKTYYREEGNFCTDFHLCSEPKICCIPTVTVS